MEEKKIICCGVTVKYAKSGRGPTNVLFMHDAPGSYSIDFNRLDEFDQSKFTLIAWNAPEKSAKDYGHSSEPGSYHRNDARIALELMKKLDLVPFCICAQGDGAQTALYAAFMDSVNVRKMILWSTSAYVSEHQYRAFSSPISDTSCWADHKRFPYEQVYGAEGFAELWTLYLDAKKKIYEDPKLKGDICKNICSKVFQPTLLIWPEHDFYYGEEEMDDLNELLPNSGLIMAEESRHNVHTVKFDWFRDCVQRFLLADHSNQFDLVREERERMQREYYGAMNDPTSSSSSDGEEKKAVADKCNE